MSAASGKGDYANRPYMEYSSIIQHFSATNLAMVEDALAEFLDILDDAGAEPPVSDDGIFHALFLEWFVFDYRLPNGISPLEQYIALMGTKIAKSRLKDLKEAVHTQRTGMFWVVGASAADHVIRLEDIATGERLEVVDHTTSGRMDGTEAGLLGTRVVRLRGTWYFPGNAPYYAPVKPTQRLKDMLREEGLGSDITFVHLAADRYRTTGDDAFRSAASATFKAEEMTLPEYDGTASSLAAIVDEMERQYDQIRSDGGLAATWERLRDAIMHEDGKAKVLDVMTSVFAGPDGTPDFPDEECMQAAIGIFMQAWNHLPHESLGGKAPAELRHEGVPDPLESLLDDGGSVGLNGAKPDDTVDTRAGQSNLQPVYPIGGPWDEEPSDGDAIDCMMILDVYAAFKASESGDVSEDNVVGAAYQKFFGQTGVDDPENRIDVDCNAYDRAAVEWIVFDWHNPDDGLTPLEFAAGHADAMTAFEPQLSGEWLERARAAVRDNFASLFWVRGLSADKGTVTLEDVCHSRLYTLHDGKVVERLQTFGGANGALIGARIAHLPGAGNSWWMPTRPVLALRVPVDTDWRGLFAWAYPDADFDFHRFPDLVETALDDTNPAGLLKRYAKVVAAMERFDDVQRARVDMARDEFRALTIVGDCVVTWESLAVTIYYAPIRKNPAELLCDVFFGLDDAMLDPGTGRRLAIRAFLDAWAVLPHRAWSGETMEEAGERLPVIDENDPLFDY